MQEDMAWISKAFYNYIWSQNQYKKERGSVPASTWKAVQWVNRQILQTIATFTYLRSNLLRSVHFDNEANFRISNASAAFGRLHRNVWDRSGIKTESLQRCAADNPFTYMWAIKSTNVRQRNRHTSTQALEDQVERHDPRYRAPEENWDPKHTYAFKVGTAKMGWPFHQNACWKLTDERLLWKTSGGGETFPRWPEETLWRHTQSLTKWRQPATTVLETGCTARRQEAVFHRGRGHMIIARQNESVSSSESAKSAMLGQMPQSCHLRVCFMAVFSSSTPATLTAQISMG